MTTLERPARPATKGSPTSQMRTLSELDDSSLIRLALEGQTECFSALMARHSVAVRRRIESIVRNECDADEVIQEVQLKVWRGLPSFRGESSFRTWMTRVGINEALQLRRREKVRSNWLALEDFPGLTSGIESPQRSLLRVEETQAVRRAVVGLPPMYRQVLTLREFEQLSVRETAIKLQSTIPAVKTRHLRARKLLSIALKRSERQGLGRAA